MTDQLSKCLSVSDRMKNSLGEEDKHKIGHSFKTLYVLLTSPVCGFTSEVDQFPSFILGCLHILI